MIAALILAAGKGERFGSDRLPKQFIDVAGKPLFIHSVATYASLPEIDRIVLTSNPEYSERMREDLERYGLTDAVLLVDGGATRQASVANAAAALGPL
ncbi:MAG: 2-C-methyl-D-erythritol 4-phosphate cytidylyltransferase, partial [Gammaproteobacteria bacterium]|nr:2-C-methyl-D-erythritol 4-phosphate cytidylyltransferase [Gammaproteobacteria bacterium]